MLLRFFQKVNGCVSGLVYLWRIQYGCGIESFLSAEVIHSHVWYILDCIGILNRQFERTYNL